MRPETATALTVLNRFSSDEHKPPMGFISRALTGFSLRLAIACLTFCIRLERSSGQIDRQADDSSKIDNMAVAALNHQINCKCKSCLFEIIITNLRVEHLYRNPPCDDVDPEDWRWSMSVCEPFTPIETALLDANDEQLIRLAFPALAPLIEKEIDARYESGDCERFHEVRERPRGMFCARRLVTHALI